MSAAETLYVGLLLAPLNDGAADLPRSEAGRQALAKLEEQGLVDIHPPDGDGFQGDYSVGVAAMERLTALGVEALVRATFPPAVPPPADRVIGWGTYSIVGHRTWIGRITETQRGHEHVIRIETPVGDGWRVAEVRPAMLYAMELSDEASVRRAIQEERVESRLRDLYMDGYNVAKWSAEELTAVEAWLESGDELAIAPAVLALGRDGGAGAGDPSTATEA